MSGYPSTLSLSLTIEQKTELERWQRCNNFPQGKCRRARIMLLRAVDTPILAIANIVGVHRKTVRKWIIRFCENGIEGLDDLPRPGRPAVFSPFGCNGACSHRVRDAGEFWPVTMFLGLFGACSDTANMRSCRFYFSTNSPTDPFIPQSQALAISPLASSKGTRSGVY